MERETVNPLQFLYWFQVIYGAVVGAAGGFLYQRWQAGLYGLGFMATLAGLVFLTLIFLVYLQNLHKGDLQPDYSKTCYACRLPVNRYSEFCEHCGADQIERHNIGACPECQAEVYEGTAFCPSCGGDLRDQNLQKVEY